MQSFAVSREEAQCAGRIRCIELWFTYTIYETDNIKHTHSGLGGWNIVKSFTEFVAIRLVRFYSGAGPLEEAACNAGWSTIHKSLRSMSLSLLFVPMCILFPA